MRLSLFSSVSVLVLAMLASATPSVAIAGFEFVAPEEQNSVAAAPAPRESTDMPAIASDVIEASPLATPVAPVPQSAQSEESMPAPVAASVSEPAGEIVEAPMRIAPQPAPLTPIAHDSDALVMEETAPVAAPSPVAPLTANIPAPPVAAPVPVAETAPRFEDEGAVVQGFGSDVPLVLALQQIVPANYRYSFDGDVQPGMRVDWTGGKPWKSIIVDLARDNGMSVDIVSNVVAFRRKTPLDVVAADTAIDSDEAMVQGLPMKAPAPVAALPPVMSFDNATDTPSDVVKSADAKDIAVDEMIPSPVAPAAPAQKVASHAETADLIWDTPPAGLKSGVATSDIKAVPSPKSWTELPAIDSSSLPEPEKATRKVEAPVNLLPPITSEPRMDTEGLPPSQVDKMVPLSDATPLNGNEPLNLVKPQRQQLASISDTPEQALAKKLSAAQSEAATPAKEAVQFDTAFDDMPASKKVEEKVILTADSETSSATEKKTPQNISAADNLPIPVISEPNAIEPASSAPAQAPIQGLTDITPSVSDAVATNALADQQQWEAHKNETLRQALTAWCDRIGVSLVWSSEYDYPLQTDVRIDANFPDAVRTLLAGFAKAQPRPMGRLFKNQQVGAQPVLVVETQRLTD